MKSHPGDGVPTRPGSSVVAGDPSRGEVGSSRQDDAVLAESASNPRADSHPAGSLAQAVECLNRNEPRRALDILDRRLAANPEQSQLIYGRALALARLGCQAEAAESLSRLVALKPNHRKARQLLGELAPGPPAVKVAPAAPGASEAEVRVLVARAEEFLRAGRVVDALRAAERAASQNVPIPGLEYVRALCCNAVGRHEEALEAVQAELALNPEHAEARSQLDHLTKALRRTQAAIPTAKRTWNSALPRETLHSIQNAGHNYSYRGIPIIKNPFDFALYPLLLWNLKPRTIIEIGSKAGGSAVWLGDLLNNFGIDGHVHSIDIVRVTKHRHPRVTFLEGDGRHLGGTLTPEKLAAFPRPWLVIEDADHSYETSRSVLEFFHPHLDAGEYMVVEDGIISDLGSDPAGSSGPHRALKEFLAAQPRSYEIDGAYCDFFGYNHTWNTNGYLRKVLPRRQDGEAGTDSIAPAKPISNPPPPRSGGSGKETAAGEPDFEEVLRIVQPYTMLSRERLLSLYHLARRVCRDNLPGNFVECGVAAGGSSALLAFVAKKHSRTPRFVYACDSFAGLPAPTSEDHHDGTPAEAAGWGAGACAAPESSLIEVCAKLGVTDLVRPVKGFFEDTLPRRRDEFGMIALLHMDGDWYESTRAILQQLYDRVLNDGVVQVDDYGFWAGCRKALHEFEARRGLRFALNRIDSTGVWFRKPDRFPVNSGLSRDLVEQFLADDPARKGVVSQMSENERFQLYHLVRTELPRRASPLRFIEIGSYSGSSLVLASLALARNGRPFQGISVEPAVQPQFAQVLKMLEPQVAHLKAFSHQAAPRLRERFERDGNFPEFIFVDGDHSCAGVRRDILDYFPLLAPGGVMAFHDYLPALTPQNREAVLFPHEGNEPGIRQACEELMEGTHHCEVLDAPLLYPADPTQTQAHFPIIPGVFSTVRAYRKPIA